MADLNELSAQEIGRRLWIARENADVRQDDAAQVIGMSRPTLVSIEKGVAVCASRNSRRSRATTAYRSTPSSAARQCIPSDASVPQVAGDGGRAHH